MTVEVTHQLLDQWAIDLRGPVALHLKQKLLPVDGDGGVIFPPTYAEIGYNVDTLSDGTKVAIIDSVGSQANRLEPIFKQPELADLVPQITIKTAAGEVSILDVGHRLGDALVRSTALAARAKAAFNAFLNGDAGEIAKLAPTSIVFGAWDSRDTSAKLPRIVQSVIRAWKVETLTRSAQYNPPVDYAALEVFTDEEKAQAEGNKKSPLAQRGFVHVPSVGAPGGVIARGAINRDVTINLVALRSLKAREKEDELRRYILGLAIVAATYEQDGFLRQGCLLTLDANKPGQWVSVTRDGKRDPIALTFDLAKEYALKAAKAFSVAKGETVEFEKTRAKSDVSDSKEKKTKGKKAT